VCLKRHGRIIGLLSISKRIFLSGMIFTAVCCDRCASETASWEVPVSWRHTDEEETDEHMVVYYNPGNMGFSSGLYLAEIRDLDVTENKLPGGQSRAEHHRNR
jgi:hypothetical protein